MNAPLQAVKKLIEWTSVQAARANNQKGGTTSVADAWFNEGLNEYIFH